MHEDLVYSKFIEYCRCGFFTVGRRQGVTVYLIVVLCLNFIGNGECVTVEVLMLSDLIKSSIYFSFLSSCH